MIDIHTHILPAIDDGAADVATSLEMLKIAVEDGIQHVILTPHFIEYEFENTVKLVEERFQQLSNLIKTEGIVCNIYPGSEIFLTHETPKLLDMGRICTLNHSSYILVELPMMSVPTYAASTLYELKLRGYRPILAHPERNQEIIKKPNILFDMIEKGMLCQVNAGSLTGLFGSKIGEFSMQLVQGGYAHFVASDAHTCKNRSPKLRKAKELVESKVGAIYAEKLFSENALAVLNNEEIEVAAPRRRSQKSNAWEEVLHRLVIPSFLHKRK